MAPSLNVALDNHVGSLPSSTEMDVVCTADSMAGTVHLISPAHNEYYQVVGDLYKAFLVHEKGNTFDSFKLQLALELQLELVNN